MYSVFVCPESKADWLKMNGANDSKQLTVEARESFFKLLLTDEGEGRLMGWRTTLLHPEHISNCMLRKNKYNLNELSYSTVFALIDSLRKMDLQISAAFVDTLGKAEKYEATLTARFPGITFTVRSKADSLYPVVGAASIIAKVIRDKVLKETGVEASGYPGDPLTVTWLQENCDPVFGFPRLVRFSWSTCVNFLQSKCHPVRWYDDEEDKNKANQRKRSLQLAAGPVIKYSIAFV